MTDASGQDYQQGGGQGDQLPEALPDALIEAMGQLVDHEVAVPDEVDQRIFTQARAHLLGTGVGRPEADVPQTPAADAPDHAV